LIPCSYAFKAVEWFLKILPISSVFVALLHSGSDDGSEKFRFSLNEEMCFDAFVRNRNR